MTVDRPRYSTPELEAHDEACLRGEFGPISKAWVEARRAVIATRGLSAWEKLQEFKSSRGGKRK